MNDRTIQILYKILSEIQVIDELAEETALEDFLHDEKTKRAVCMTLINIGELVKSLPSVFMTRHPEIPWKSIAGIRDITAHKYQTLLMEDVW